MCLAIPARVIALTGPDEAVVDLGGIRKTVSIALVPDAAIGEYVIVHVGHAIGRIDAAEAARTLALFGELAAQAALADTSTMETTTWAR
ncbi:HypC/HybG/HupF family hydrogenase formation chaperone [Pseudaquabacterium pictum]|uniref:Hydrogenase assembly protein HupF n=1 Tax=Pseudaquabacterium pictum TaxID=2315236 RepID=A0A480AP66_9BURK|nr:HypC/HybG/HupF family hydrogenase formation chaperone [Rubrivivax pictus]GCL62530.1 hydrogenase assembly protein HupF [Rubrivivax pictus]